MACVNLVYFANFGIFGQMKIWQPCAKVVRELKRRAGRAENKKTTFFREKNCASVLLCCLTSAAASCRSFYLLRGFTTLPYSCC
jgi:hypothetical protein